MKPIDQSTSKLVLAVALASSLLAIGSCSSQGASPILPDGGSLPDAGDDAGSNDAGTGDAGSNDAGTVDAGVFDSGVGPISVTTKLPVLPEMSNVVAFQGDDSASINFDPYDGAKDYRVYPLPDDADILLDGGSIVVRNAIYRCAGTRETPMPNIEQTMNTGAWVTTQVDGDTIGGYPRTLAGATLGYVYTAPDAGLVPVYALGESDPNADNGVLFARWAASRTKLYTTSESARASMLASYARDDGIAFYVPAASSANTTQIYLAEDGVGTQFRNRYYFADGAEASVHSPKTAAFFALSAQAPGTQPLMRVYYQNGDGWSHDELAVGQERFNRAYHQGDRLPAWSLLWAGITGPTTLVVEALDKGCPYQGHLSPQPLAQLTAYFGTEPLIHQPFVTLDQMRTSSPTGEVFINGQAGTPWVWATASPDGGNPNAPSGTGTPLPNAIARSFVQVAPIPHPQMDFFAAFSADAGTETFTTIPCGSPDGNCFATWRQQSATYDQMFINAEYLVDRDFGLFAYGQMMGEWWVTFGDVGADTNGKYRLTPFQKGTMSDSSYFHATMEVDGYATARRYPQLIISDQDIPVQYNLVSGHSLVVQPRAETTPWSVFPVDFQLQICNLRTWDVNNQCPVYDLYHLLGADGGVQALLPGDELGEHVTADRLTRFDVYASSKRVYLFLDGSPYACANLPAVGAPAAGPVTVTWGDVLYHSGVDQTFAFHADQLQIDTRRHFDNLGFSSGVAAPAWDESRFPCAAPISLASSSQ